MLSIEELLFAQRYPFSSMAKNVVKEKDFSLDNIPEEVINRAKAMVLSSIKKQVYKPDIASSKEALENEILAFPLAKVIISSINKPELYEKFANTFSTTIFSYMGQESEETISDLAGELGVNFSLSEREDVLVKLDLKGFLSVEFKQPFMKLVNQRLDCGKVYLNRQDFIRFLSAVARKKILHSLPADVSQIPHALKEVSKSIAAQSEAVQKKRFKEISFGKLNPNYFPPCMAQMYSDLLEGKNLSHLARFDLASFLATIRMGNEQIISLFKNTPNFKERITSYQVNRIFKGKYAAPSCAKIRSHGLCPTQDCNVKHPVQFYRNKFFEKKKEK